MSTTATQQDMSNSPAAWFAVLEAARRRGDTEREALAERELRRLGVRVQWFEPTPGREGADV